MNANVPVAEPTATFSECLSVMNEGRMGVAVIMQAGELCGIITDGDIRRTLAKFGAESLNKTAEQIMSRNPKTIADSTFLGKAEEMMKQLHIHSLIALDDEGKVSGLMEFSN